MSLSEKRVLFMRYQARRIQYCPADLENYHAVIAAYTSGELDLAAKQPGQVAMFFGGRLMTQWGFVRLDLVGQWKYDNPKGRMWVEEVSF